VNRSLDATLVFDDSYGASVSLGEAFCVAGFILLTQTERFLGRQEVRFEFGA